MTSAEGSTTTMQTAFRYDCTLRFVHLHFKFTGKERDAESGLDYFGATYYASSMGRFMSPDKPVDQHPEDPQSWNLYSYVTNNPLSSIDQDGNYDCGHMTADQCTQFGNNLLLFSDLGKQDACTDPACFAAKTDAHVAKLIEIKPQLIQISTVYGQQQEGSKVLPRNKYVEVRSEKPKDKEQAKWPEFKSCKFTTEAIITEGSEKGELRNVCSNPACPVHHPPKKASREESWKREEARRRSEQAIAEQTSIRILAAISAAIPVRLMKRDLLFINTQLAELIGETRLEALAKQHGIKRSKDSENIGKLFAAYLRRSDEGTLSRIVVERIIVLAAFRTNAPNILHEAATVYNVDTDAIAQKVKAEFETKAKKEPKSSPKVRKAA